MINNPKITAKDLENVDIANPDARPIRHQSRRTAPTGMEAVARRTIPNILPNVICFTAAGFSPPRLPEAELRNGVRDDDDDDDDDPEDGEKVSHSRGFRQDCRIEIGDVGWRSRVDALARPVKNVGRWVKTRDAIAILVLEGL